jgi:hypothetical protein
LKLRLRPEMPRGPFEGTVRVQTNVVEMPFLEVAIRGDAL